MRVLAFIATCAFFISTAIAQPDDTAVARASLIELMNRSSQFRSVHLIAQTGKPGEGDRHRINDIVMSDDGSFAARYFSESNPVGDSLWSDKPSYFVYHSPPMLHVARATGLVYQSVELGSQAQTPPGLVQYIYAPWPMLPEIGRWILDAADAALVRTPTGFEARSIHAGLCIQWSPRLQLTQIIRTSDDSATRQIMNFEGFDARGLPTSARELFETSVTRNGKPVGHDIAWSLSIRPNPPDSAALLSFEPVARTLAKFDPSTKDVVAPDGTFLYNEDAPASLRPTGWFDIRSPRFWGAIVIVLAVIASVLMWVRSRRLRVA